MSTEPLTTTKSSKHTTILNVDQDTQRQEIVRLLDTVLGLGVEMMNADRGAIVITRDEQLKVMASRNFSSDQNEILSELSTSFIRQVIESGKADLTHDALADPRFGKSASVIMHQITSIICAPLSIGNLSIGALYLDSRHNRQKFTNDNLTFIDIFARMAAIAVDYAYGYTDLYHEKQRLQSELQDRYRFDEIIGKSARMREVFNLMGRVMNSDISVLLEGESGTGKELVARALHYNGPRRDKPFVAQFCGNLSENLLESELFGHKKGAFTGAFADKKGLFEIADGGTFFLDEIADISPTIQSKLLRVIQEGEIRRVGDTESRTVNVRIISATNKSLKKEVELGKFREDLFYRLNVITIRLPALRERVGDIHMLAKHFLKKYCQRNNLADKTFSTQALQTLNSYDWPGNVRELENTIERAVILSNSNVIDAADLFLQSPDDSIPATRTLKEHERDVVLRTLEDCGGNKTKTAEILGVSLRWLHYKLNEWKDSAE